MAMPDADFGNIPNRLSNSESEYEWKQSKRWAIKFLVGEEQYAELFFRTAQKAHDITNELLDAGVHSVEWVGEVDY